MEGDVSYPGRSVHLSGGSRLAERERIRDGWAEVSRGHSRRQLAVKD